MFFAVVVVTNDDDSETNALSSPSNDPSIHYLYYGSVPSATSVPSLQMEL